MVEIYNEEYKDLLGKTLPAGKKHQVSLLAACVFRAVPLVIGMKHSGHPLLFCLERLYAVPGQLAGSEHPCF